MRVPVVWGEEVEAEIYIRAKEWADGDRGEGQALMSLPLKNLNKLELSFKRLNAGQRT